MNERFILLPHLRIQNANALSSPFTIGFPAMTAWLGAVHALQRKLNAGGFDAQFDGVGVVSHQFDLQTYQGPGDFDYSIIGTANPVDKDGSRPAFIEEARCHLEVSLVLRYENIDPAQERSVLDAITHFLHSGMKMAGGDILSVGPPAIHKTFNNLKTRLMPGYALIERRELMLQAMEQGQDALDALLDYLAIHHHCEQQETNGQLQVNWSSSRKTTGSEQQHGWIVPIATGFHGISELGQAKNQRDPDTPHRFAESVVTLGEFKMPYKMSSAKELLWHYHFNPDTKLYLCQQHKIEPTPVPEQDSLFVKDGF